MKKKILLGILLVFLVIQAKRVEKTNPALIAEQDIFSVHTADVKIQNLFKNACYDCHSHETKYPWYFNVAPVSWWAMGHVEHARDELNFSIWKTYSAKKQSHKLEESIEKISEKEMPLLSYIIAHSEARLSETERMQMADWLKSISGNNHEENENHNEED